MVRYIIILFILFFASCSNLTLEMDSVEIKSINNGSQLTVGDSFTIAINSKNSDVIPTSMDIKITNIDSVSREVTSVEPVVFNVDLIELEEDGVELVIDKDSFFDGLYILFIDVKDESGSIKTEEIEFSVFSGEIIKEIKGVLPSKGLYTDSKVILQSRITSTQVDPYLVWSHDGEVIDQGYLSDGTDQVLWDSKSYLGFNEIKLDIFPYKFSVFSQSNSNIIFSTVVNDINKDIFDPENYYKAHLFNGNYIDEENKELIIDSSSEVIPKIIGSYYGLEFLESSGFTSNKSFIPHNDGLVINNSLILNMLNLSDNDGLIFKDLFGSFETSLVIVNGEMRFIQVADGVELINTGLFYPELNVENKLVITTLVYEDSYELLFYNNGELLNRIEIDYVLEVSAAVTDQFLVGGFQENGAEFLIDSFMVYINDVLPTKRNNIYSGVFTDFYGESVLGSGFNSIYIPENVYGEAYIDGEVLTLQSDAVLDLGYYLVDQESYTIDIFTTDSSRYLISFQGIDTLSEVEASSSLNLKRKGEFIFIDGEKYDIQSNSIKIVALEETNIDNIIIYTRETIE